MRHPFTRLQAQLLAELEIEPSVSRLPDRAIGRELPAAFDGSATIATRHSRSARPCGMRSDKVDAPTDFGGYRSQLDALENNLSDDGETANDEADKSLGLC